MITGVHGARFLQVNFGIGIALGCSIVRLVLLFLFECIQAVSSPQPNPKQNSQQKNEDFQRLRPKMTSSTNRDPA